tara:strand:+ start:4332 stop:5219 length:888 start_codon:yes stop_codon:yes gene_type:complete
MLGIFKKTFKGLEKTRKKVSNVFSQLSKKSYLDEEDIELLEDCLSQADISYTIINDILESVKDKQSSDNTWRDRAHSVLMSKLQIKQSYNDIKKVIILVGINGSGKTTSAAKLAKHYSLNNEKVCLVAGDTYRAAAVEQIEMWSKKLDVRLVQNPGTTDPASVAFDGVESGMSKGERVIVDTAGRLHTSVNLMNELEKIYRVVSKITDQITTLMVIDGNIGKNSLLQLEEFNKYLNIDGIIITKLDGTAKGGVALTAISDYKIPVYYIGVGEGSDDLVPFSPEDYLNSILGKDNE